MPRNWSKAAGLGFMAALALLDEEPEGEGLTDDAGETLTDADGNPLEPG